MSQTKCDPCKPESLPFSTSIQELIFLPSNDCRTVKGHVDYVVYCLLDTKVPYPEDSDPQKSSFGNSSESVGSGHENSESVNAHLRSSRNAEKDLEVVLGEEQVAARSVSSVHVNEKAAYFKIARSPSLSEPESVPFVTTDVHKKTQASPKQASQTSPGSSWLKVSETAKQCSKSPKNDRLKSFKHASVKIERTPISCFDIKESNETLFTHVDTESAQSKPHSFKESDGFGSSNDILEFDKISPREQARSGCSTEHSAHSSLSVNETLSSKKVRCETMDVKLQNQGDGFGIELGFDTTEGRSRPLVPVVTGISPKSPAQKIGVVNEMDRVIAINQQNLVGLPAVDLELLKRRVFSSDVIVLTVEFDVQMPEMQFGAFDVVLERNLKTGLIFEGMKKGRPLVISGVVRGSAAHRSGQVFPGDKILAVQCVRDEQFYPVVCNYLRNDFVKVTIRRDPLQEAFPDPSNSFFYSTDGLTGENFIIRRTSVRSAERGKNSLILDQEVTLFRDPIACDFGFLVGQHRETRRAYVSDVREGGPAHASGVIKKYDRIVEVNGVPVGRTNKNSILTLLMQTSDKLDLLIRRTYHER